MRKVRRMTLWDTQFRLLWDSAVATIPAYLHVGDRVNAVVEYADGGRWSGLFYRCPEGIRRWSHVELTHLSWPVYETLGSKGHA